MAARQTVLVVDDDLDIREVVRIVLEEAGYIVLEAQDGEPALRLLRATPLHLVMLLNLSVPNRAGLEVLHTLEANPTLAERHACVLMTTATRAEVRATQALLDRLGVPILAKPFDLDVLVGAVDAATERLRFWM